MSRHTQQNTTHKIAYGNDHICGLFIQVFDRARVDEDNDDEGLVVNLDQIKGNLTPEWMCDIAEEYGFHIEPPEEKIVA